MPNRDACTVSVSKALRPLGGVRGGRRPFPAAQAEGAGAHHQHNYAAEAECSTVVRSPDTSASSAPRQRMAVRLVVGDGRRQHLVAVGQQVTAASFAPTRQRMPIIRLVGGIGAAPRRTRAPADVSSLSFSRRGPCGSHRRCPRLQPGIGDGVAHRAMIAGFGWCACGEEIRRSRSPTMPHLRAAFADFPGFSTSAAAPAHHEASRILEGGMLLGGLAPVPRDSTRRIIAPLHRAIGASGFAVGFARWMPRRLGMAEAPWRRRCQRCARRVPNSPPASPTPTNRKVS